MTPGTRLAHKNCVITAAAAGTIKETVNTGSYGKQIEEFLKVKNGLDPLDRFGNELTRSVFKNH